MDAPDVVLQTHPEENVKSVLTADLDEKQLTYFIWTCAENEQQVSCFKAHQHTQCEGKQQVT